MSVWTVVAMALPPLLPASASTSRVGRMDWTAVLHDNVCAHAYIPVHILVYFGSICILMGWFDVPCHINSTSPAHAVHPCTLVCKSVPASNLRPTNTSLLYLHIMVGWVWLLCFAAPAVVCFCAIDVALGTVAAAGLVQASQPLPQALLPGDWCCFIKPARACRHSGHLVPRVTAGCSTREWSCAVIVRVRVILTMSTMSTVHTLHTLRAQCAIPMGRTAA